MNRKLPKYKKIKKKTKSRNINKTSVKLIVSLCIFLLALSLKLLFPDFASSIKNDVLYVLNANIDFEKAVSAISKGLAGETGVKETANEVISCLIGLENDTVPVGNIENETDNETDGTENAEIDNENTTETNLTYNKTKEEMVAAFIESKSEFSSYDLPAGTTYQMPDINIQYVAPVKAEVSSSFGYRVHPNDGAVKFHYGLDLACSLGSDVLAFSDGEVISANDSTSYGLNVVISHSNGVTTRYAHCSEILVKVGDTVKIGDVIAKSGDTGNATGPCLHFEVRVQDVYVNPEYYLSLI